MCFTVLKLIVKHYYVSKGKHPPSENARSMWALALYLFSLFFLSSLSLLLTIQAYSEKESIPIWVPILPIIGLLLILTFGACEMLILLICKDFQDASEINSKKTDVESVTCGRKYVAKIRNCMDWILAKFVAKDQNLEVLGDKINNS